MLRWRRINNLYLSGEGVFVGVLFKGVQIKNLLCTFLCISQSSLLDGSSPTSEIYLHDLLFIFLGGLIHRFVYFSAMPYAPWSHLNTAIPVLTMTTTSPVLTTTDSKSPIIESKLFSNHFYDNFNFFSRCGVVAAA